MQQKHGEKPNQAVNSLNQGVNDPLTLVIYVAKSSHSTVFKNSEWKLSFGSLRKLTPAISAKVSGG